MHRFLTVIAFSMLGVSAAAGQTMQLSIDGRQRSYVLVQSGAGGPSPTIIMLHGAGGTADREAQRTGLDQLAPRSGFAAVFPQSQVPVWNRYLPGQETPSAIELFRKFGGPPNDRGFLRMLIADLIRRGIADPKRIYLAGSSNGGIMALGIMCLDAGPFAGIALAVASMTDQAGDSCLPSKPLPAVMLFGTADVVVPYRGGPLPLAPPEAVWSADQLELFFRKLNGCQGQSDRSVRPGQQQVEIDRWTRCAGGPVRTLRVVGGTHLSAGQAVHTGRMMLDFFRDMRADR